MESPFAFVAGPHRGVFNLSAHETMGQDPIFPPEIMIHDILDLMTCPSCDGDVYINTSPREERELVDETMSCLRCGAWIPVKGGVPRFAGRRTDQQQIAESVGRQSRGGEDGQYEQRQLHVR